MQHVRNCGPQQFIISRKGGTLLAINDFIYRSNLKRFGRNSDKVYWECIHNRSKKCRSRLKTIGDDLFVTNYVHNHSGDGQRIDLARRAGMLIYKKFSSIGLKIESRTWTKSPPQPNFDFVDATMQHDAKHDFN